MDLNIGESILRIHAKMLPVLLYIIINIYLISKTNIYSFLRAYILH